MNYLKAGLVFLVSIGSASFLSAADNRNTGELWLETCARCHGDTGRGETPLGRKLKVCDYSTKESQKNFTDEYLTKMVLDGKVLNGKTVLPAH